MASLRASQLLLLLRWLASQLMYLHTAASGAGARGNFNWTYKFLGFDNISVPQTLFKVVFHQNEVLKLFTILWFVHYNE